MGFLKWGGCCESYLCNPKHFSHRIIILCLTCMIGFGAFFCYDNPAALQSMFLKDLDMTYESYMSLYAAYSWPNILMSFVGGFLLDTVFGIRLGTIIFAILTIIGQLVLSLGVYINGLWLMVIGRLIFGIGSESLCVSQNTYAAKWFQNKELNIVFGLQISISRLGSTINSNTMSFLYFDLSHSYSGKTALSLSLLIASCTCIMSLLCAIGLGYLDLRADKLYKPLIEESMKSEVRCRDMISFTYGFWSVCVICLLCYSSIFPFVSLAQSYFIYKYDLSIDTANLANSLIYAISAVASPFIGFGVDFLGLNMIWLTSGLVVLFLSHILLAFTNNLSPFIITVFMGFALSIVASSLWGLVPYMVSPKRQGTAFGLLQGVMNLGMGVVAIISGVLVQNYGFFVLELFFLVSVMISFCALICLFQWDMKSGGLLNSLARKRRQSLLYHSCK